LLGVPVLAAVEGGEFDIGREFMEVEFAGTWVEEVFVDLKG
jgi:hypothetical protein